MTFLPDASTIDMFGIERNLHQYADLLRVFAQAYFGNVLENLDPIVARCSGRQNTKCGTQMNESAAYMGDTVRREKDIA